MLVQPTAIHGAWLLEAQPVHDDRGFFARLVDRDVLEAHDLRCEPRQRSVAFNHRRGTVRGLHWQATPHVETKLVRCTRGRLLDALVDVRPDSPTYLQHETFELDEADLRVLFVPPLVAHGYQTLADATEVSYDIDGVYEPSSSRGLRFDDPCVGIEWPLAVSMINERDRTWPLLDVAGG